MRGQRQALGGPSHSRQLIAVFVAYFTSFFVMSTINVALPRIAAELDGMSLYSWAFSIPALASALVTLIFGKLSDLYGRRILLLASIGFIGLGTIPTINALVVQYAVPKRLLGVATGGLYFFVMLGRAIAPAILGSMMDAAYAKALASLWPAAAAQIMDKTASASFGNPRVLLSAPAMADLQRTLGGIGDQGPALFEQTVHAIRYSLETGLRVAFLISAVTMLVSFLLILTIPEISLDVEPADKS